MKKVFALVMALVLSLSTIVMAQGLPVVEKNDRFDILNTERVLTMISRDGELVIHVNDDCIIIFEDGTDARERLVEGQTLAELLDGRNLIVSYSISTRSLPPQTTPEQIVILYETPAHPIYQFQPGELEGLFGGTVVTAVPPIHQLSPEELASFTLLNGEIVVLDEIIEASAPIIMGGEVMVPLRAIAEALGFEVKWDDVIQGIRLGVAINCFIGRDYYTVGRMAPIELGAAPELIGGQTYVPLTFFRMVVSGYDAYVFEGQVVIDIAGRMQ
ncbi:MAG: copper amine oxidase N-terminal domain-containing protein [Symbiobacteriaceae bacterium]|nr:copper amine oxidase N-terminal domain-containing protein [Symbiobacteriaceae bacterium]